MGYHSAKVDKTRLHRVTLVGLVVMLLCAAVIGVGDFISSRSSSPVAIAVPGSSAPSLSAAPPVSSATSLPTVPPSMSATVPSVVAPPIIPDLKSEVKSGVATHLIFPSIGLDEPLVPLEIVFDGSGQPILPQDVRAYLATNLNSRNCDVSGGDFIMGHTSTFTDYWGKVPFNAFKSLTPGSGGQLFSIGKHQYVAVRVIVQPKAALTTTKEFWCQPRGNVSIVSCYTQEEGGDNIIVIGRPVS